MRLLEVHLRNWRSYRNATFQFPARDDFKNVVLIGAQNGTGKTSFLIALYLALYGREAMPLIEGVRISGVDEERGMFYRNLLEQIIHRPALKSDDPYTSVSLKFETRDGEIIIKRKWGFGRNGKIKDLKTRDGEEVLIEFNGNPKIYPTWQDANAQIQDLLFPVSVMPCFFFDGEQAQKRVEATGGRALLDAVNTLYGTGILDQLAQSLKTYINNETFSLRRDVGDIKEDELDQRRKSLDKTKDELEQINLALAEKLKERDDLELIRQTQTNELHQIVGDSSADIEEYSATIRALESEEISVRHELTQGLASLALPLAMQRCASRITDIVSGELVRERWLLLKDEATGKAARILNEVLPLDRQPEVMPALEETQITQLRRKLERSLEALWSPPPDGCAEKYFFPFLREADRAAVVSKINRFRSAGTPDITDAVMRWNNVNTRLRETQRRFESVKNIQPRLSTLKTQLTELNENVRKNGAELAGLELREQGLTVQIRELKATIGQMEKKRSLADPVQQKLEVAHHVRTVVEEAKDSLIPLCKASLEERCTVHFQKMISEEYRNFKARFEAEGEPRLEGPVGQVIYVNSLSGAQKRAFGLAFTLAVADVSGQEAPIVIDTPVGNMDSKYRDRVLQYVAEAAPGQVIFLSHDEEISAEYFRKLKFRTVKTFLVTFDAVEDGSGFSTVFPDRYFEGVQL